MLDTTEVEGCKATRRKASVGTNERKRLNPDVVDDVSNHVGLFVCCLVAWLLGLGHVIRWKTRPYATRRDCSFATSYLSKFACVFLPCRRPLHVSVMLSLFVPWYVSLR